MENVFIIAGTIIAVVGAIFLIGYLKYKKVDIPGWFKKIESALSDIKDVTEVLENNTTGKYQKTMSLLDLTEKTALSVVKGVEKKYLSGDVSKEDRKKVAVQSIEDFLISQGIKVSDELKNFIDVIVSDAVDKSGVSDTNKQIDAKVSSIEKQLEETKSKLNETINENTTLKTTITSLQNKFATAQNIFNPVENAATAVQNTTVANNATVTATQNNTQK